MRVTLNGLIIDKQRAGIGHYGYNLINSLIKLNSQIDFTFYTQKVIDFDSGKIVRRGEYNKSYKRILDEQLLMPFKYRGSDLIHFIDYSSPFLPMKIPFIVTIHDLSFYEYPDTFSYGSRKIKEVLAPISIKRSARIIADSENTKRDIVERFPNAAEKVRVIYPGRPKYDLVNNYSKISDVRRKYGINGKYILVVGTFEPRKNLVRMLEAFKIIAEKFSDINLVLIGKKGWLYGDIYEKINDIRIAERVISTGYVDDEDMPYLYRGAEVFCYPSLYEGFGLPPLEAMSCGTPVVVSNTSSLPEVVGDAGIYIDPYDIESIANGIIRVLNDSTLRQDLKNRGLKQCEKFSWERAASQVIEVYREILE